MSPRSSAARSRGVAAAGLAGPRQLRAGPVEHRRRAIDADDRHAGARHRHSTRPVPQPSSRTRPSAPGRQAAPERDVAAAERARVLPVVERRVLVPALPALSHGAGPSSRRPVAGSGRRPGLRAALRDGHDQHRVLDFQERRAGVVGLPGVALEGVGQRPARLLGGRAPWRPRTAAAMAARRSSQTRVTGAPTRVSETGTRWTAATSKPAARSRRGTRGPIDGSASSPAGLLDAANRTSVACANTSCPDGRVAEPVARRVVGLGEHEPAARTQ